MILYNLKNKHSFFGINGSMKKLFIQQHVLILLKIRNKEKNGSFKKGYVRNPKWLFYCMTAKTLLEPLLLRA